MDEKKVTDHEVEDGVMDARQTENISDSPMKSATGHESQTSNHYVPAIDIKEILSK